MTSVTRRPLQTTHLCCMKALLITIFWTLVLSTKVLGQFNEIIRSGRPGQAMGAFTMEKHVLQVQSGIDYFRSIDANGIKKNEEYLSNTVLRYGITRTFEVSGVVEYKSENVLQSDVRISNQGLSALDVGMRAQVLTGKGVVPNIAFQVRMRLPALTGQYEIKNIAPILVLATSQQLFDKFTLITNWGTSWNGNDSSPKGSYVVNLSLPLNDRLGAFAETFGSLQRGVFISNVDAGFVFLLTKDLQVDAYGGYGMNQGIVDYFVSTGVSWRMKTKARDH